MRILISGSTGLIGSALRNFWRGQGHDVYGLVREKSTDPGRTIYWDPLSDDIDEDGIEGFDAVIHLAGENIASGRWTARQKDLIRESRVKGTKLLAEALAQLQRPPHLFVSASAIGFYGNRGEEELNESSPSGSGFLPVVSRQWEKATQPAQEKGIRVVLARFGLVLSAQGGALPKMLRPFKMGVAGKIGDGRQYISWISVNDVVGSMDWLLSTSFLEGPINIVSPHPVTNAQLTKALGQRLLRPTIVPFPACVARFCFGEMADEILLSSARVYPARLLESGYSFVHAHLDEALKSFPL